MDITLSPVIVGLLLLLLWPAVKLVRWCWKATSDKRNDYDRGYEYATQVLQRGDKDEIYSMSVLADGTFDKTDFDRGIDAALIDSDLTNTLNDYTH